MTSDICPIRWVPYALYGSLSAIIIFWSSLKPWRMSDPNDKFSGTKYEMLYICKKVFKVQVGNCISQIATYVTFLNILIEEYGRSLRKLNLGKANEPT